jgi:RimJ/RimL family protein N-acetyltransferase
MIQLVYPDHALVRRGLIDEGFMDRADGVYWRTGGRYEQPHDTAEKPDMDWTVPTERDDVVLRPYNVSMIDDLVEAANDPRIPMYMSDRFASPYTKEDAEEWIDVASGPLPPQQFAIFVDDHLAGGLGGDPDSGERAGSAEIGWWINPQYWGRGITTVAARALIDFLFETLGLMRLWAPVMAPNVGSSRVAEKAGMHLEGTAPAAYLKNGVRMDQLNYGITREQWLDAR